MKNRSSRDRTKAVVLLSGGMDSAVALWWALKKGWACQALAFDYGQRHSKELAAARRLARRAKVPLLVGKFALPWSRSALTDRRSRLPRRKTDEMAARIPPTYVPGRNTLFLGFGLSCADQIGATAIVIGANAIDYSGYPDCRPNFLAAFEKVASLGTRLGSEEGRKIRIVAPLVRMTKADIVRLGRRLGTPLEITWSCYRGGRKPCGVCDSCRLRQKGFDEAGER